MAWTERETATSAVAQGADFLVSGYGIPVDAGHWNELGKGLNLIQRCGSGLRQAPKVKAKAAFLFPRTQCIQLQEEYWNVALSYELFLRGVRRIGHPARGTGCRRRDGRLSDPLPVRREAAARRGRCADCVVRQEGRCGHRRLRAATRAAQGADGHAVAAVRRGVGRDEPRAARGPLAGAPRPQARLCAPAGARAGRDGVGVGEGAGRNGQFHRCQPARVPRDRRRRCSEDVERSAGAHPAQKAARARPGCSGFVSKTATSGRGLRTTQTRANSSADC